jgi:predicted transcriptional regulator
MTDASGTPRRKTTRRTSARRFELINAFVDRGMVADLSPRDALVWVVLFRHAQPDRNVRVSAGRLAETLKVHRSTIVRSLRRLRDTRLLIRVSRGGPNGHPTTYKMQPFDPDRPTLNHART